MRRRRTGKEKCETLRRIREQIACRYNLKYTPEECHHEGDCPGTCPKCDAELRDLTRQLKEKGIEDIRIPDVEDFNNVDMDPSIDMAEEELRELGLEPELPAGIPANTDDEVPLKGDAEIIDDRPLLGMPTPRPSGHIMPVQRHPKRKLFKTIRVAGLNFHDFDEVCDDLEVGQRVFLIRDQHNEHDPKAVAIAFAEPDMYDEDTVEPDEFSILGYVPRNENEQLATLLDMGWGGMFVCEISRLNPDGHGDNRLYIEVYIKSKEAFKPQTWLMDIDALSYFGLVDSLEKNGFAYFRWYCSPDIQSTLPREGDKVAMIYDGEESGMKLHLMYVTAIGSNAAKFLSFDEIDMVDDCAPFVLTNIIGPVPVDENDRRFILDLEYYRYAPETRTSGAEEKRLMEIIYKFR